MKRQRGRSRKGNGQTNRHYESNGPDIKIRGSASHIYEKYLQLARDSQSSGDRVMAENYLQHAEHYYRIVQSTQPAQKNTRDRDDARDQGPDSGHGGIDSDDSYQASEPEPLAVVSPEGADGETSSHPSEMDGDDGAGSSRRPRRTRRPRTSKPATDAAATDAMESVASDGATGADADPIDASAHR